MHTLIRSKHFKVLLPLLFGLLIGFQNCGPGFKNMEKIKESPLKSDDCTTQQVGCEVDSEVPINDEVPIEEDVPVEEGEGHPEFVDSSSALQLPANTFSNFSDTRIFQRANDGKADVKLSLVGSEPSEPYQIVRVLDESGNILESSAVREKPFSSTLIVRTHSGMAYRRLRVSYFNDQGFETSRWVSNRFAVGEVFIAAGQSNAATHGQSAQKSNVAMNRMINPNGNQWLPLADPMPVATNWTQAEFGGLALPGGSPWPAFADSLSQSLEVPVAVISVGYGGSSVLQWQKGNAKALYPRLIQAATAVSGCSFRAVLWHQGESDSLEFTSTGLYMMRMNALLQNFRADTGCTTQKWIVAQAAYVPIALFLPSYPGLNQSRIDAVAAAQRNLWKSANFAEGPNTDQWTAAPSLRFDQLHFSNVGLQMHALAWRDKVIASQLW